MVWSSLCSWGTDCGALAGCVAGLFRVCALRTGTLARLCTRQPECVCGTLVKSRPVPEEPEVLADRWLVVRSMPAVPSVSMQARSSGASHLTESISHPGARSKRVMTDEQDTSVRNFPNP